MEVGAIYRRYAPIIHRRALRILGSRAEAEDAVHDIFLKLHDALPRFRGDAEILTWVYRITTNHCLNRLRSRDTERRVLATQPTESADGGAGGERAELRDLLREVLRGHSVEDVAMLFHRHADEMTQVEIAEAVGLSERTVRDRLKRIEADARAALAVLAKTWEDEP